MPFATGQSILALFLLLHRSPLDRSLLYTHRRDPPGAAGEGRSRRTRGSARSRGSRTGTGRGPHSRRRSSRLKEGKCKRTYSLVSSLLVPSEKSSNYARNDP